MRMAALYGHMRHLRSVANMLSQFSLLPIPRIYPPMSLLTIFIPLRPSTKHAIPWVASTSIRSSGFAIKLQVHKPSKPITKTISISFELRNPQYCITKPHIYPRIPRPISPKHSANYCKLPKTIDQPQPISSKPNQQSLPP